jgi:hypothetical protein
MAFDRFMHYTLYGSQIIREFCKEENEENRRRIILKITLILLLQQRST